MHTRRRLNYYAKEAWGTNDGDDGRVSGGGWTRVVAARLHNSAVTVMGGKMKIGYDLAQL